MERPDRIVSTWRKSTHSGGNGSNCVEVAASNEKIMVRDTKNPESAVLTFPHPAWHHFAARLSSRASMR